MVNIISAGLLCRPVRGDNLRALASGLSPVQADNSWYNYFTNFNSNVNEMIEKYRYNRVLCCLSPSMDKHHDCRIGDLVHFCITSCSSLRLGRLDNMVT